MIIFCLASRSTSRGSRNTTCYRYSSHSYSDTKLVLLFRCSPVFSDCRPSEPRIVGIFYMLIVLLAATPLERVFALGEFSRLPDCPIAGREGESCTGVISNKVFRYTPPRPVRIDLNLDRNTIILPEHRT